MFFAALLMFSPLLQPEETPKAVVNPPAVVSEAVSGESHSDAGLKVSSLSLSAAPIAKVKTDAEASAEPLAAPPASLKPMPMNTAFSRPKETRLQRRTWYALDVLGHSGAILDAWSTRRAISTGYCGEANPLLRPFAHSNAIYAATQVSPAFMDYLGKRLMISRHPWVRRLWWVPQSTGASFSFLPECTTSAWFTEFPPSHSTKKALRSFPPSCGALFFWKGF
jgi:hypothetical protein